MKNTAAIASSTITSEMHCTTADVVRSPTDCAHTPSATVNLVSVGAAASTEPRSEAPSSVVRHLRYAASASGDSHCSYTATWVGSALSTGIGWTLAGGAH